MGADVTTTSQLNADPVESRTDIVIDPTLEATDVLTLTFELDPSLQFAEPADGVTLGSVMTIEMTALDQIGEFGGGGHLGVVFNVVPEPTTILLLTTGRAALAWRVRRQAS